MRKYCNHCMAPLKEADGACPACGRQASVVCVRNYFVLWKSAVRCGVFFYLRYTIVSSAVVHKYYLYIPVTLRLYGAQTGIDVLRYIVDGYYY